ncbi:hypothetical protein [Rhodohalobacter sulfatireducens]|uniref:Thioredoxin domain-containing protein n=1 Tax=Rhodohalobacter sulfatireducens TaxID=2911366 RepID=A0ABS9KBK9_9BACT|nr:hypothetical protein [Rhodohalobacter sulfatireducens]MCG2588203.1 hypothetical protein [Rhodohalobacter sulfatireducens]
MSTKVKYLISVVLILLGVVMLVLLQPAETIEPSVELPDSVSLSVPVDLQFLGDRMEELVMKQKSNEPKILPLMVVTTKICPPCVNNMDDYANLLKNDPLFFEPTLVFVDVEKTAAERFVATTDLDITFKLIRSEDAVSLFLEAEQNLMFVDPTEQVVFHDIVIPNGVTQLAYKEGELHETVELWKRRLAENTVRHSQDLNETFHTPNNP